ncbi:MAG: tetratricopeptide repeat protein [Gammaproteobacteria bacterium]|nr:tetratricopeptide repeat protein [Gammaproteobacteria bacterium]
MSIKNEYRIISVRRSGQHAVINWLCRQLNGNTRFFNDVDPGVRLVDLLQRESSFDKCFLDGVELDSQVGDDRIDNLVYNHEDVLLDEIGDIDGAFLSGCCNESFSGTTIIVVRDFANVFASRYFFEMQMPGNAKRWKWDDVDLWMNHASMMSKLQQKSGSVVVINMQNWTYNTDYRKKIADQLSINFTDAGYNEVGHIGSTFDGDAQSMRLDERWKKVIEMPGYRSLFDNVGAVKLNDSIFGVTPAVQYIGEVSCSNKVVCKEDLGLLLQNKRFQEARNIGVQLIHETPGDGEVWFMLAAINASMELFDDTIACCKRVLEIYPAHFQSMYNLAIALQYVNGYSEALFYWEKLREITPQDPNVLASITLCLNKVDRFDEAIALCADALKIYPQHYHLNNNLGLAFFSIKSFSSAIKCFNQAVSSGQDNGQALSNIGLCHIEEEDYESASACFKSALKKNADLLDSRLGLIRSFKFSGDYTTAKKYALELLHDKPDLAEVHEELGIILVEMDDLFGAIHSFQKALSLAPGNVQYLSHLGNTLFFSGQHDQSRECYEQAICLSPEYAQAHWHYSWVLLLNGEYEKGWCEYEWRFEAGVAHRYQLTQPEWNGEVMEGGRILLYCEQGFGDAIQFVRYARLVKEKGFYIIIECRKELLRIFENCSFIDEVLIEGGAPPCFDVHYPLLSLPALLKLNAPAQLTSSPYISCINSPCILPKVKNKEVNLRIGITWQGNPGFKWNHWRSCSLDMFKPIIENDLVQTYSLQKGVAVEQLPDHDWVDQLIDLGSGFNDFADTAAAMQALDIIITTDTSVAHLAGALGCETWILLSTVPDWRWLKTGESSIWYPNVRLFRQTNEGDWDSVMQAVYTAIQERIYR